MVLPWVKRIGSNTLVGNSSAEVIFLALSESGWWETFSSMHDVLNVVKNSDDIWPANGTYKCGKLLQMVKRSNSICSPTIELCKYYGKTAESGTALSNIYDLKPQITQCEFEKRPARIGTHQYARFGSISPFLLY